MANPTASVTQTDAKKALRSQLILIMLVAFAIRLVVVFFTYRDLPDADKFYEQFGWEIGWVARALASGHGFSSPYWPWSGPTALVPPLYPTLLAGIFRLFGTYSLTSGFIILSLNSLFSSLTAIPVYFSAKYSLGARAAKYAAWAWAFYPFAVYFSAGRVWEYALTALLFTTCFCIAQRIHSSGKPLAWLGWGALFGFTALSNPAVLATLPFLLLLALYKVRRAGGNWLLYGALTCLATLAILAPWTLRNYRVLGVLCPVRDGYWMEIYDTNAGDASLDPSFAHPSSNPVEMRKFLSMGETAFMAEKHTLAIDTLKHHPEFVLRQTARRILYYWTGFWSLTAEEIREQPFEPANIFYVGGITFLMLRGIRRLWRLNRSAVSPYLALVCFFPIPYYLTHPLMDYRQPIEPAIVVLAVAGAFPWRRIKPGDTNPQPSFWIGEERAQ